MTQENFSLAALATKVAEYLEHGAATLLFDAQHPDNRGLPARMDSHVVRVDLADAQDYCQIGDTHLTVEYLDQLVPATAELAWVGMFYLRGRKDADNLEAQLVRSQVPQCFEPNRLTNVERALNQMGLGRSSPSAVEWNLGVSASTLADDADRGQWCPDKRIAVQTALAGQAQRAVLLIDTSHGDVTAPPGFISGPHAEWQTGRELPWDGIEYGPHALVWHEHQGSQRLRFEIPWLRIGGIQDPANGRGWFWPTDLPDVMRESLRSNEEIWPALERASGIPLAPPPPPPAQSLRIAGLSPPRPQTKQRALYRLLRLGTTVALVDARVAGVRLPDQLPGRVWMLMVPLNLPNLDSRTQLDEDGFMAVMPDHDGKVAPVCFPWRSVFLLAAAGGMSVCVWEEDYPDEIVQALHVLSAAQSRADVAPESYTIFDRDPQGDGLGMSLECDSDGKFGLHISQPVSRMPAPAGSPPGTQVRALLELSFSLPPPATH